MKQRLDKVNKKLSADISGRERADALSDENSKGVLALLQIFDIAAKAGIDVSRIGTNPEFAPVVLRPALMPSVAAWKRLVSRIQTADGRREARADGLAVLHGANVWSFGELQKLSIFDLRIKDLTQGLGGWIK